MVLHTLPFYFTSLYLNRLNSQLWQISFFSFPTLSSFFSSLLFFYALLSNARAQSNNFYFFAAVVLLASLLLVFCFLSDTEPRLDFCCCYALSFCALHRHVAHAHLLTRLRAPLMFCRASRSASPPSLSLSPNSGRETRLHTHTSWIEPHDLRAVESV